MASTASIYQMLPHSVFNSRLGRHSASDESTISTLIEEENRLSHFIEHLPIGVLSLSVFYEEGAEHPYMLSQQDVPEGRCFQIIEPKLAACAASCILDSSVVVTEDTAASILEEIKQALLMSIQDGVQHLIFQHPAESADAPSVSLVHDDVPLVRNVSFLGRAVDIVKLDPLNILNSISIANVLDYSFNHQTAQLSADGRFGIPPGTKLHPKPSLDVIINTSIFEETTTFSNEFSSTVTLNAPALAASASSSAAESPMVASGGQKEILVQREHLFPSYTHRLVDIVKKHKREAKILINKINFSNIWRTQAKSQILTEGAVRLDLQGLDSVRYNYQIQVGSHTIATVLISRDIAEITSPSEQAYAVRKIKSGFQKSLDDCHIYLVEFKKAAMVSYTPPALAVDSDSVLSKLSAFSASMTYDFVKKSTLHSKNTVTCSTASHSLYVLMEDGRDDPATKKLDGSFLTWVEQRLDVDSPDSFRSFIETFGTHYVTAATYGGTGFQVLKIAFDEVQRLNEQKISLETAAQESLFKSSISDKSESGYSSYSSTSVSKTVFLGGTVLPTLKDEHLDLKEWSESVAQEPVPIQVSLSPIADLLVPKFFPKVDKQVLASKQQALQKAVRDYLKSYLPPKNEDRASFTAGLQLPTSWFTLENPNGYEAISAPYSGFWSTIPYLFPTLKEKISTKPLTMYFCVDGKRDATRVILDKTFCYLGSLDVHQGIFGSIYSGSEFLAFYGTWPQAYFESVSYSDRCGWEIEKVNTTQDPIIRDGDEVRFKHLDSGEYLSNVSLKDEKSTATRTKDLKEAIFIIRRFSN